MAKKLTIGTIAVFIFVFIFDWVFHGMLLSGIYERTADLWRPMEEHMKYFKYMLASHLLFALFMNLIFIWAGKCSGVMDGVKFGALIGGLFFAMNVGMYCWMPLPSLQLPILWSIGGFLKTIGIGVILSLICCRKKEA